MDKFQVLKGMVNGSRGLDAFFSKEEKLRSLEIPEVNRLLDKRETLGDWETFAGIMNIALLVKRSKVKPARKNSKFLATIFIGDKVVCSETGKALRKSFDKPQNAERWIHRKLFDEPYAYGKIEHNGKLWDTISREAAMGAVLNRGSNPVMKRTGKVSGGWKPQIHVKQRK